jgi:single-strand DNA-binding protein
MNFNECILAGRLTRDPEMREVNGTNVVMFTVATNRSFTKKNGEKAEKTLFMDCELWGNAAPIVNDRARKGTSILVRGSLEQDNYEAKDGSGRRTRFKLRVEFFQFGANTVSEDTESVGTSKSGGGDFDDVPF